MTLLQVDRLVLRAGGRPVVDGIGFTVDAGETVGLVGPSGSGKTSLALAVLGHCREGVTHAGGAVLLDGRPMLPVPPPGVRGGVVGYVGQDPGASLNPFRTVGASVGSGAALERVGHPAGLARRYPHQLSGGQQQRAALAIALARRPRLLVLDEPTSGLDLLATAEITAELLRLREGGTALLWIGHDMATLASAADRLLVMAGGQLVEEGRTEEVLTHPRSTTGRALVSAHRRLQHGHLHATRWHEGGHAAITPRGPAAPPGAGAGWRGAATGRPPAPRLPGHRTGRPRAGRTPPRRSPRWTGQWRCRAWRP
jgi:peptide/nickel transport system ATP-binding protein